MVADDEQAAGEQHCQRQGQHPGHQDGLDGLALQAGFVGNHGPRHRRREDVGGGHRHTSQTGDPDGGCCRDLGRDALAVGHTGRADLLAHGMNDTTPAHHGAATQRQRDGDDHPGRCVFSGRGQVLAPFGQISQLLGWQRQLGNLAGGVIDTEQQTTHFAAVGQAHLIISTHGPQTGIQGGHRLQHAICGAVGHQLFLSRCRCREVDNARESRLVALVDLHDALVGILGPVQIIGTAVHVQCEIGRRHTDQHQHHQTDALLAIVGAVHEADAHGRGHQGQTRPERRVFLAIHQLALFRRFVDLVAGPDALHRQQQQRRDDEADGGRDDEGKHDVDCFAHVNPFCHRFMGDPGIGTAYPQNGTDQGM